MKWHIYFLIIGEVVDNNNLENSESETIVSTSIYTISGQLIQTVVGGQRDVLHLPIGMYILQHRMSNDSVRSEKITNNHHINHSLPH
ncbi:MAG: T9SS type A sorting domain-containing protein [Paludibacteraceae bacterium]|nr:T9SS type A sorting domain-containing protein [Paludibacteraceae bacterium]